MTDTANQCDEIKKRLSRPAWVLIVDDEDVFSNVLVGLLSKGQIQTMRAASVEGATQLLESIKFDLIFLDLKMPKQDGIALLEWLKIKDIHIPVAVVTGFPLGELAEKASKFDILTILPKPVSTETIKRLMCQLKLWTT